MAVATSNGSERMSTMSAVSIATSVPAPIAIPRSAWASAGASLRRHLVALGCQSVEADVLAGQQPRISHSHVMAVDFGHATVPGNVLKVSRCKLGCTHLRRAANDRLGQRVLGVPLHPGC